MGLNVDMVRQYVEMYMTYDDTIFNEIYNDVLGEYNYIKNKYNIINDDNYLMALLILQRGMLIMKIRNAKMTNIKAELLMTEIKSEIKRVLSMYSSPFIHTDLS